MTEGAVEGRSRALSRTEPHYEFLELCAVWTSGQLTAEEQKKLQEHLSACQSCRDALREYQVVVDEVIPAIGASQKMDTEPGPSWSEEEAERALFKRLALEEKDHPANKNCNVTPFRLPLGPPRMFTTEPSWRYVWLLYASGILLFLSLGFYAYRSRTQLGSNTSKPATILALAASQSSLEQELGDAGHTRKIAQAQIAERDKLIADLRRRLAQQSAEFTQLKASQQQLQRELRSSEAGKQDLAQHQVELAHKLETAQNNLLSLQNTVDSLMQQSARDASSAQSLEARSNDLARLVRDREATIEQQQDLLAHDRDIRELMGARDLYIAEVYDVARTRQTKKPYGRVFYTRGKSLIFYAYDLDQQAEVKNATRFQAWGRRGPDRKQALNLGIFYEDNVSKRRWVLKCDDPKMLAQIDGVFVTLEPHDGSQSPSGKSLLFASLRIDPNHP
jgi:DNA repair exonuclease SbcCD ATPase subunit